MSDEKREIAELTRAAEELAQRVVALNAGTGGAITDLAYRARSNRRFILILAVVSLTLAVLTTGIAVSLYRTNEIANRVETNQTVGRQRALCPLYGIFLGSKSEAGRQRSPNGPEAYDRAFKVIEEGYHALECDEFKGGPPKLGR